MAIKSKNTQVLNAAIDTSKYPDYKAAKEAYEASNLREAYEAASAKKFPLSDDHIYCLISCAENPEQVEESVWVQAMEYMTQGKDPADAMSEAIADEADNAEEGTEGDENEDHPEDAEVKEGETKETKPAKEMTPSGIAKNIHRSALAFAERAKNDAKLREDLAQILMAPKVLKRGAIVVLHHLHRLYSIMDDEGTVLESDIDGFPVVGSKYVAGQDKNTLFDIYEYVSDNNGDTKIKGSWTEDLYLTVLPEAQALKDDLDLIKAAIAKNASGEYKKSEWTESRLKARKSMVQQSYNAGLKRLRDAIQLRHKQVEFNEKLTNLIAAFDYARDPKTDKPVRKDDGSFVLRDSNNLIMVAPRHRSGDANFYSTDQFLKINIETALKNGGTLGAVKETISKAPSAPGDKKKEAAERYPEVKSGDDLDHCMLAFANFFANAKTVAQRAELSKMFNKRLTGEGRMEMLETLDEIYEGMQTIYTPNLRKEYSDYLEQKAKKQEQENAAKAA